jgi:hypothetical protein
VQFLFKVKRHRSPRSTAITESTRRRRLQRELAGHQELKRHRIAGAQPLSIENQGHVHGGSKVNYQDLELDAKYFDTSHRTNPARRRDVAVDPVDAELQNSRTAMLKSAWSARLTGWEQPEPRRNRLHYCAREVRPLMEPRQRRFPELAVAASQPGTQNTH